MFALLKAESRFEAFGYYVPMIDVTIYDSHLNRYIQFKTK